MNTALRSKILGALLVAGVAIPAGAHAKHQRETEIARERELAAFTEMVAPIDASVGGEQRVTLNGAPLFFRKTTERGTLDGVMARVAQECASGSESEAFGLTRAADDGESKPIRLQDVVTQGEGAVRASLCVFENREGASEDEVHRVRYTLAQQREDGSVAVTTVVNASSTPIAELWPAEGDAPGSDLPGVARPENARRTLTAIVGKGAHAVRVYETPMSVPSAVDSYDRQMHALGFVTTGSLEDARMYRKDGQSFVASFRATTAGSTVALMPFGTPTST